jgi:hypothetical protein
MVSVAQSNAPTNGLLVGLEKIVCSVSSLVIKADQVRHGGSSVGHLGRDWRGRDICGKFSVLATSRGGAVGVSKTAFILERTSILVTRSFSKEWSYAELLCIQGIKLT